MGWVTESPTQAGVYTSGAGDPWYNVKDSTYGAKGTGGDDTNALIATALAAQATKGTMWIPPGSYGLGKQLPDMANGPYSIRGAGAIASRILILPTFDWTTVPNFHGVINLAYQGATGIGAQGQLSGLKIDGQSALPASGGGKWILGLFQTVRVDDVGIDNCNHGDYAAYAYTCQQSKLFNLNIQGCSKGLGWDLSHDNQIYGGIYSNSTAGLNLEFKGSAHDIELYGTIIDELSGGETASAAITDAGVYGIRCFGVRFWTGNTSTAFDVRAGTGIKLFGSYCGPWTTGLTTSHGLKIAAGSDVYASGCELRNSATQGGTGGNGLTNAGTFYDGGGNTIDAPVGAGVNQGKVIFDMNVGGHFLSTASGIPASSALGANVTSVTPSGNDTRGELTIVMAGALAANTRIATITFATTYGATAPKVILVDQTSAVGIGLVNFYVSAQSTGVSFDIASDQALGAGTYKVDYIVIG